MRDNAFQTKKLSKSDYLTELRREMADEPEQVHLGGLLSKKSKFMREQEELETLEQEHFSRKSLTKAERKLAR